MTWRFAIVAAGLAAGCAEAGRSSQARLDAAPITDAPRQIDAPSLVDAPAATCTTTVTCATAMMLPGIGGDESGAASSSTTGYQAAWFSIRLTESDSSAFADPMSIQTMLSSPTGAMFDLLVFVDTDGDQLDCTAPTGTVMTNGASQTSNIEWGETGTFANGSDDSRTISIQISPHAGTSCSPTQPWSLSILGGID